MKLAPATDSRSGAALDADLRPTYLDCNATTPVDPRVLAEVIEYLQNEFGNAGSRTHSYGQRAKERVNQAREEVAAVVGSKPDEVVFTSGATESNNLALLGLEDAGRKAGRMHIVSTQIEHKAVLEPLERLRSRGFNVTLVSPNPGGWVDPADILREIRPDTLAVSVMGANNETGVVQPIAEIADGLAGHDAYFHVDAAQTFGKRIETLRCPRIDLVSISGHKLYAPKGVGALVARRRGYKRVPLTAQTVGGGQERGLRSGTLPVALIAGLGTAAANSLTDHVARDEYNLGLRGSLLSALGPLHVAINGDIERIMPHTLNFSVPGVDSEAAIVALKDIVAVSNGSACTSQSYDASHVLTGMRLDDDRIQGALRFSWSHLTPEPDWVGVVSRLQRIQVAGTS
jgi:cysteine desulfurase